MRIQAISQYQQHNCVKRSAVKNRTDGQNLQNKSINQPSFKGAGGGVFGFMTGGVAGLALTAAALTTPVGWIAAAALYGGTIAGSAVGAAVGSKLGDLVDPDEKNGKNT